MMPGPVRRQAERRGARISRCGRVACRTPDGDAHGQVIRSEILQIHFHRSHSSGRKISYPLSVVEGDQSFTAAKGAGGNLEEGVTDTGRAAISDDGHVVAEIAIRPEVRGAILKSIGLAGRDAKGQGRGQ